jgi:ribosome-binding protein aMBF1 (putative translation factor)
MTASRRGVRDSTPISATRVFGRASRRDQLREAGGQSRTELAAELDLDPSTIGRWESGEPVWDEWKHVLAERFGVSVEWLCPPPAA